MKTCVNAALLTVGLLLLPARIAWADYIIIDLNNEALGAPNRLGGAWSFAHVYDINDDGLLVGDWQDNAYAFDLVSGAFLPSFTTSGTSYATGVNDLDQIVGHAGDLPDNTGGPHTFRYDSTTDVYTVISGGFNDFFFDIANDGTTFTRTYVGPSGADLLTMIDPSLGWTSIVPRAVNDDGIVVGWGRQAGLSDHAVVLIPIPVSVPEPTTLSLVGIGVAGLALHRRRRKKPLDSSATPVA